MTTPAATETATPRRLGPVVQYALLAGPLLTMVDSSIINVAIAPIAQELHGPLATVQWAVSGYLLALGTGLAMTSYLARRFGTLPVYRACLVGFTLASAACAAAPTVTFLVSARAVQGLVGAPLVPLAMSMLLGKGRVAEVTRAMSPLAGVMLFAGPALGPTIGGALIGVAGWRAVFLINVPVGALAALSTARVPVALAPGRDVRARLDVPGLALLATGLTLLLFGTSRGGSDGWGSTACLVPLTVGVGLLAGYGWWAHRHERPALDLSLARDPASALALTLAALASIVTFAAIFLLPLFVQSVQGHGAVAAGLAMLPQGVITGLGTALGARVIARVSVRTTVITGFGVMTVASLGLLGIDAHTSLVVTAAILAARGAAIGLVITPLLMVLTRPLQSEQLADANTLFNIWQRVAGSLGVGLIAALYAGQSAHGDPVTALHVIGLLIAAISAASAFVAVLIRPRERASSEPEGAITR